MEKLSMWELRDDQICFVNIKNEYLEYLNRNGDSRVPVEHSEQVWSFFMEKLSMWELRDDQICFVNIKNEYLEYLNRNGDSRVPVEHSEQGRRNFMEKLSMWELRDDQICFVNIKNEYLEYLNRNGDSRVPVEHSEQGRRKRPYIGILLTGNLGMDYVLPLTSPKPKHQRMRSSLDFHRLDSGKLGAVPGYGLCPSIDLT